MSAPSIDPSKLPFPDININDPAHYIPNPALVSALEVAIALGQPLLVTGQPGKHYRNQVCLSDGYVEKRSNNGGCTALKVFLGDNSMTESFSVSVNGKVLNERIDCTMKVPLGFRDMCEWVNDYYEPILYYISIPLMTPLNGNCKKKGILGYIAGGTVMGVLLVAFLCYCWIKRRRASMASSKSRDDATLTAATHVVGGTSHGTAAPAVEDVVAHGTNPTNVMSEVVAIALPNRKHPTGQESENGTHAVAPEIESNHGADNTPQAQTVEAAGEEDFA